MGARRELLVGKVGVFKDGNQASCTVAIHIKQSTMSPISSPNLDTGGNDNFDRLRTIERYRLNVCFCHIPIPPRKRIVIDMSGLPTVLDVPHKPVEVVLNGSRTKFGKDIFQKPFPRSFNSGF